MLIIAEELLWRRLKFLFIQELKSLVIGKGKFSYKRLKSSQRRLEDILKKV